MESSIVSTFIHEDILLSIDTDKVQAVSLEDYDVPKGEKPKLLYRRLTKNEKWEVICSSFAYGKSGKLYWLFKSLILWWTKDLYPKQGTPSKPRSNFTRIFPFNKKRLH